MDGPEELFFIQYYQEEIPFLIGILTTLFSDRIITYKGDIDELLSSSGGL